MRWKVLIILGAFAVYHLAFVHPIHASSQQAYEDYIYQFDQYRSKYAEFSVAKNEYLKFKTLTAQTTALDKTRSMLSQRDQLLRAYLLLLNEKLNEDQGMNSYEKTAYQKLISNEIKFLDGHSQLIGAIGSLEDADSVSRQLESHYGILQASIRQTITGISLGGLVILANQFDQTYQKARQFVDQNRPSYSLAKQQILDRWLLQVSDKRNLYQQKVNAINLANTQLKGGDITGLDKLFTNIQIQVREGKQYLSEGSSYLGELTQTLRFAQ